MPTTPPTRRRWYQFGLGTMFAAVTLVALGFGWRASCLRWIQQRHDFIEGEWAARKGKKDPYTHFVQLYPPSKQHKQPSAHHGFPPPFHIDNDPEAPLMLRYFGEEGVAVLCVLVAGKSREDLTPADKKRLATAKGLCPEASINYFYMPEDGDGRIGTP